MADSKITALTSISTSTDPAVDPLVIVDVSDTSMAATGTTKKVTLNNLLSSSPTATGNFTITGALTVGNGTSATQTFSGVTNILDIGFGSLRGGSAYGDVRLWTDRFRIYNNAGTQIIKNISGTNGDETWYDGAGGTRMTFNSTGLGIGVASPATKLDVAGNAALTGTSGFKYLYFNLATDTNSVRGAKIGKNYDSTFALNIHATTAASGSSNEAPINFYRNNTDISMTLDTSGRLLVNATGVSSAEKVSITASSASHQCLYLNNSAASQTGTFIVANSVTAATSSFSFADWYANGVAQFRVSGNGVIYAQNTVVQSISDLRLKENISNSTDGLDIITALRPVRYDWKAGYGNDRKNQLGFIAQEIEAVFADAVGEWELNGETYKTVGPSALIPVLVKAIQELTARVQTLEAR